MYTFSKSTRILWQDEWFVITDILQDGALNLANIETDRVQTVAQQTLTTALFVGALKFERLLLPSNENPSIDLIFKQLTDCTPQQEAAARFRHWVITPLVAIPPDQRSRSLVQARIAEVADLVTRQLIPSALATLPTPRTAFSVATAYRWLRQFEQAGKDIRVLIPNWQQRGATTVMQPEVETILQEVTQLLYLQRERHTIDDVFLEVTLRIPAINADRPLTLQLALPCRSSVYLYIRKLEAKKKLQSRIGRRAARRVLSQYAEMETPDQPLYRIEVDHTPIDLIVVDAEDGLPLGRPTLTSVLDVATRYPLGFYLGFEPPSYLAVCEALAHAFKPKGDVQIQHGTAHDWIAYGLPHTLVVDNGKEFRSNSLEDACLSLGIELQFSPVAEPHFRGSVERLFRTFNTGLFHTLDGTTFSNIFQRGDYASLKLAKLTLRDVETALHLFLLDFYAERFHAGLQGIPARRWENALAQGFQPRLPADVSDIDILLGHTVERTLFHYGVEVAGLRYNSEALSAVRLRMGSRPRVKVKIHPGDISVAYIYVPHLNEYIHAPALDQSYASGLSRWKHRVIRAFLRQERGRVNATELAWAKRKIRDIVTSAKSRQKQVKSRRRVARWEAGESPQPQPVPPPQPEVPEPLPDIQVTFSPEELEADGWHVSRH